MKAVVFCSFLFFTVIQGHSTLGDPRPNVPRVCRLGGTANGGFYTCPGPCDLRDLGEEPRNATSPSNPARIYRRGQLVSIKYQRNNHGPGGFVRLSLVPISEMMKKTVHAENAFYYGCWGAKAVPAKPHELGSDADGFSYVGGDGKLHNLPISYYELKARIPAVVPDGNYVLGWVWYGGLSGSIYANTAANPYKVGHFGDYWSCSFVRIKGGRALEKRYTPVFVADLKKLWGDRCWSAADAPGICSYEPCKIPSRAQKPREFKNGAKPKDITPRNFGQMRQVGNNDGTSESVPTPVPDHKVLVEALRMLYRTKLIMWGKENPGSKH